MNVSKFKVGDLVQFITPPKNESYLTIYKVTNDIAVNRVEIENIEQLYDRWYTSTENLKFTTKQTNKNKIKEFLNAKKE